MEKGDALHSLAVDMSVYLSSPGAPLRAPVFLLALFSTKNDQQKHKLTKSLNDEFR